MIEIVKIGTSDELTTTRVVVDKISNRNKISVREFVQEANYQTISLEDF